ncbi:MAG: cell division ATP-binding protein FtsE [Gammaproteobacteria bacterium]
MVRFEKVSKRYEQGHQALQDVSFQVNAGERVFITGHSGAGKSTLLKLVMAMERPTQGHIYVGGRNIDRMSRKHIPQLRRSVGMIFQDPHLLHDRTVFENVALPLHIMGCRQHEIGKRVRAALDKVHLLNKEAMLPQALSCGEQQRVGIARAVVNKPSLLLADEPTGNLDPDLSNDIMNLFTEFSEVGVAVIIVTHDLELISHFKARRLTLQEGKLISDEQAA